MPDFPRMQWAALTAAATAALVVLLCARPRSSPRPRLFALGWVLGLAVGFCAGCLVLGLEYPWPPRNVQGRFLALVLPLVVVVELLAVLLPSWAAWTLRLGVAAATTPILLHSTRFVAHLPGMDGADWSPAEQWLIQGGLGAGLAAVWIALAVLARRAPRTSVPFALALSCAGASLALMLSDYATGGPPGFSLAGVLLGAALVAPRASAATVPLGIGVVGLFGLLVDGRFSAGLTSINAALLFLAPLLAWLPEAPYVRRIGPWLRGLLCVLLVGAVVAFVVGQAKQKFEDDSKRPGGSPEPSLDDYRDFGK
jgi:hypothetical protein